MKSSRELAARITPRLSRGRPNWEKRMAKLAVAPPGTGGVAADSTTHEILWEICVLRSIEGVHHTAGDQQANFDPAQPFSKLHGEGGVAAQLLLIAQQYLLHAQPQTQGLLPGYPVLL